MHGNLSWIDWAILVVAVVGLRLVSMSTRHYMKGVADFLSANRLAGRYLLTIASQMGNTGAVSFIAIFEMLYSAGLAPGFWGGMMIPVNVIILLTGWVFYRFRETRALTMAQFFEMRYNRKFRIFAGSLCWITGIINFGIFPAVAARFFIYYCGLPDYFHIPGIPWELSTFATVMIVDLGLALSFVTMGGQISVMVTECVQGIISSVAFCVVAGAVLVQVSWPQMVRALAMAPADKSMLNPFHTSAVTDFNVWYQLIAMFGAFYAYMAWQGGQGFFSSAKTPHEQKMGGIIGVWRAVPQGLAIALLALAAIAVMRLPEFSAKAALVNESLKHITNESVKGQMRVPIVAVNILPVGVKGLLAMIFLFFSFTCHDTYMHSWGSIFIQDVYMPIRNKVLSPEEHIKILRWSIMCVAAFAFVFSLLYQPTEKIYFFFAITGTIWLGGSGAVIIGGLYWRRGTTAGAYAGLISGAVIGTAGLILPRVWKARYGVDFPINGQWLYFIGMVSSALIYGIVSLCTCKQPYNLEQMLHRGKYTIASDDVIATDAKTSAWQKIVGITDEFSRSDKILAIALIVWNALNFLWFVAFTIINLMMPVSDSVWATSHYVPFLISICLSIPVTIWFTIGGVIDIKDLLSHLKTAVRDASDDGRVHHALDPITTVAGDQGSSGMLTGSEPEPVAADDASASEPAAKP